MKKLIQSKGAGLALAALAFAGLSAKSEAIFLQYEDGPLAGQVFTQGAIEIKIVGFNTGSIYNPATVGAGVGSQDPAAGVPLLDAITVSQAASARPIGAFGNTLEDSWGIFRVTTITDLAGFTLYTPAVKGYELSGIAYGVQDFFIAPDPSNPARLSIDGVGLQFDLWQDGPPVATTPNPFGGPVVRTGDASYPTYTDGVRVLALESTPGFIHAPGTLGGTATEFNSSFNFSNLTGQGTSFLNVVGGTDANQFNTNTIQSAINPALFTDVKITFTTAPTTVGGPNNSWLVRVDDPATTSVIPEPTTALAGFGCLVPLLGSMLRRRRVATSAA